MRAALNTLLPRPHRKYTTRRHGHSCAATPLRFARTWASCVATVGFVPDFCCETTSEWLVTVSAPVYPVLSHITHIPHTLSPPPVYAMPPRASIPSLAPHIFLFTYTKLFGRDGPMLFADISIELATQRRIKLVGAISRLAMRQL
ncbi:hypothetical protein B0H10DRAFT_2091279, partial [Mycena sp. CBHHK59/15]